MAVPRRPALDFLARSQMMKNMNTISPPTSTYIIRASNCSVSMGTSWWDGIGTGRIIRILFSASAGGVSDPP
ncbi:hypothetical protein D3C77_732770 [compost metagenome]